MKNNTKLLLTALTILTIISTATAQKIDPGLQIESEYQTYFPGDRFKVRVEPEWNSNPLEVEMTWKYPDGTTEKFTRTFWNDWETLWQSQTIQNQNDLPSNITVEIEDGNGNTKQTTHNMKSYSFSKWTKINKEPINTTEDLKAWADETKGTEYQNNSVVFQEDPSRYETIEFEVNRFNKAILEIEDNSSQELEAKLRAIDKYGDVNREETLQLENGNNTLERRDYWNKHSKYQIAIASTGEDSNNSAKLQSIELEGSLEGSKSIVGGTPTGGFFETLPNPVKSVSNIFNGLIQTVTEWF